MLAILAEGNPLTAEKIELGRRLFFDRRLSRDGSISCSSCHDPERAFSDGRPLAVGVFGRTDHYLAWSHRTRYPGLDLDRSPCVQSPDAPVDPLIA